MTKRKLYDPLTCLYDRSAAFYDRFFTFLLKNVKNVNFNNNDRYIVNILAVRWKVRRLKVNGQKPKTIDPKPPQHP